MAEGPPEPGTTRPPRQHAFPTPVSPPPSGRGWTAGGWRSGTAAGDPPGPPVGPPGPPPEGPGRGRPGAPPRRSSPARGILWTAAILAVVILLVRAHRLTTTEVIWFCILIPSLILHEVSHGVVALAFGDDTARRAGRLSLNPLRHVDVVGTLIVPAITVLSGFGFFGWAKPVPVNVGRLRSPRNQGVLVSLAGPFTNVVIAAAAGLVFWFAFVSGRLVPDVTGLPVQIVFDVGVINLWVACFNLIPIPPLDGSAVIERMLPSAWWPGYLRLRPYGLVVILGGLVLLSMAHVYPLAAVFEHLQLWWAHLLGV